jgi:DNA-directed RNA polymerase sigma subunit (sigma70/sigma32)
MKLRLLEGATLGEVGKEFGVTRDRVRQRQSAIVAKIDAGLSGFPGIAWGRQ